MKLTGITFSIQHRNSYYNVQFDASIKQWTVFKFIESANQYKQICNPIQFTGRASTTKSAAERVLLMGIHAFTRGEAITAMHSFETGKTIKLH